MQAETMRIFGCDLSCYIKRAKHVYVLLHGLACSKEFFSEQLSEWDVLDGYVAFDLIGFGSTRCPDELFTQNIFEIIAEIVKEISLNLEVEKISLVLHSMASLVLPFLTSMDVIEAVYLLDPNIGLDKDQWSYNLAKMGGVDYNHYYDRLISHSEITFKVMTKNRYAENVNRIGALSLKHTNKMALRQYAIQITRILEEDKLADVVGKLGNRVSIFFVEFNKYQQYRDFFLKARILYLENYSHFMMFDSPNFFKKYII